MWTNKLIPTIILGGPTWDVYQESRKKIPLLLKGSSIPSQPFTFESIKLRLPVNGAICDRSPARFWPLLVINGDIAVAHTNGI